MGEICRCAFLAKMMMSPRHPAPHPPSLNSVSTQSRCVAPNLECWRNEIRLGRRAAHTPERDSMRADCLKYCSSSFPSRRHVGRNGITKTRSLYYARRASDEIFCSLVLLLLLHFSTLGLRFCKHSTSALENAESRYTLAQVLRAK